MRERLPDLEVYRQAAYGLTGTAGARAAGFLDGYRGCGPNAAVWHRDHQLDSYEDGWLEGALRAAASLPLPTPESDRDREEQG